MLENTYENLASCTITVLTFERPDQLEATLNHLRREFRAYPIEVIVIDNGSTANSKAILRRMAATWPQLTF